MAFARFISKKTGGVGMLVFNIVIVMWFALSAVVNFKEALSARGLDRKYAIISVVICSGFFVWGLILLVRHN